MYDCQDDICTDFSFADFDTVGCARPLSGILTAEPAGPDTEACLTQLASYAAKLGYRTRSNGYTLTVLDISLPDALAINARFGSQLIVSCDLRRDPPVRFG